MHILISEAVQIIRLLDWISIARVLYLVIQR
jgi:hypothetical protein